MPDGIKKRVEGLVDNDKQPAMGLSVPLFEWRPGQDVIDPIEDDEVQLELLNEATPMCPTEVPPEPQVPPADNQTIRQKNSKKLSQIMMIMLTLTIRQWKNRIWKMKRVALTAQHYLIAKIRVRKTTLSPMKLSITMM